MASGEDAGGDDTARTARTVGQLVKYSREVNQSQSVNEVGTYAIEATFHVLDGHPSPTVAEVRNGECRVLESMRPDFSTGDSVDPVTRRAYESDTTVVQPGPDTTVNDDREEITLLEATEDADPTIAVPSYYDDGSGAAGVVVGVTWTSLESVEQYHVKPIEYLADHVATAVTNVRSRERLERAREDLERRKELIELYDRLLRHDLGNDLQIISGYSETLSAAVDGDEGIADQVETIRRTATNATDLIERVGDLVKTLESVDPQPRDLRPILESVVRDVDAKYDSLTVEFDPETATERVYAGDLLDSVVTNVLSNAAVHNEGPVTVVISVESRSPETVVVEFADDGAGVDPAVREEIFEMGRKGPESDGTGFGLGFARALTQSYGGDVAVGESDRGCAAFSITLPRA